MPQGPGVGPAVRAHYRQVRANPIGRARLGRQGDINAAAGQRLAVTCGEGAHRTEPRHLGQRLPSHVRESWGTGGFFISIKNKTNFGMEGVVSCQGNVAKAAMNLKARDLF